MGKTHNNKKHNRKKDKIGKRKRSKEEHFKRKLKTKAKKQLVDYENTRYDFDSFSQKKVKEILSSLESYSTETKEAVTYVFHMLDTNYEVNLTDVENGFVRESLQKIFSLFSKQLEKTEDRDGQVVYIKSGKKSLDDQIRSFYSKLLS